MNRNITVNIDNPTDIHAEEDFMVIYLGKSFCIYVKKSWVVTAEKDGSITLSTDVEEENK